MKQTNTQTTNIKPWLHSIMHEYASVMWSERISDRERIPQKKNCCRTMESDNKAVASCAADLIPYRCPKCGNRRRFATLRELKLHFESDHAFKTACVRPAVFRKDKENASQMGTNPNEQTYVIKSERIFSSPRNEMINSTCHDLNSETERTSPLLQSYKDEAAILELELQMSKQNEMRNKTENLRALSGNTVSSDFKSTLDALSKEVVKTRKQHWNTADALYQSHDIMNGLEEAAETKCKEQRDIIRQLLDGMRVKDRELKLATKEQNELRNEQERLYQETEELFRRADQHNETLKRELNVRNGTLESLNNELERIKSRTSSQLKEKENELKVAEEKMNRLRSERDQLIEETEMILKRADADSEELRLGLAIKEQTLKDVNEELNTLRNEKHLMLLKTMEFYKRTEEGNDIMKNIIRAKDEQLDQALEQLEKMKVVQKRLVEESQNLTDQADDNTTRMRVMLEAKKQEVEEKVLQLEKLKEEKLDLESQTKRTDSSLDEKEKLQGMVKKKEELSATKGQLKELKSFLQSAAEKERTARGKLEKFISELITRAERAESELRSLKSQSSSSLNGHNKLNKDSTKERILADDQEENSSDLKITPAKPVRKKYSPAKPIRRQYNRNKNLTQDVGALRTDTWQDKFATSPGISSDIKAQNRTGSGKSERTNRRVIHTINADIHKPVTDKVERDFQQKASVDDIDINFVTTSNSRIIQRQETIPKTKKKFKSNDQNIYMSDKLKVQNYPVLHNVSPHPAASSACEQNLSSKNIITAHMQKYHNQITAHSEPIKSQSFLYPLTFQSSINAHEIRAPEKPQISEYGYYLPQPPQIEPAAEFRAPPYGHESTFSLNSIPRVPPHIYHLNNTPYGIGSPLPNVVRNQNRPHKRPSEQYAMVDFNSDTHSYFTPHHKLTAERRTTQSADKTFTSEAVEANYSNPVLGQTGLQKSRQEIKNYESKEQRMSSDRKGTSEQVQYKEIQADEIDFPDELYVIPKSASDELTPDLLTPERETIEEKFRRTPEQMQDEYDQTRGALTRELVRKYIEDRSDRNFERIMDDNGILWDDMATLPDVSDSELDQLDDRLSPSGSEAIATKIQPNIPITNTNSNVINDRGSTENLEQLSVKKTSAFENGASDNPNHSAVEGSGNFGQSSESSPLKDKNVHGRKLSPGLRNDSTGTERRQEHADDKLRKMGILSEREGKNLFETTTDSNYRAIDLDRHQALIRKNSSSKRFKPINASNSGKSSSSDKEMTSGGEEIHNFLRKSKPNIVHGSPDCRSDFTVKTDNDKLALDDHSKINKTFDEKLRQISEKYSLKRHHSDMNQEKDNIKAITDKYRQRRKDILAQIMISHSSNDNDSYLKPINRIATNPSKSAPVQEQINKPIDTDLLRQAILNDKQETETNASEGPENTGSRNVLENGEITSDIQIRNCTVTNVNLKSFHRHLNFEDNKENNIKINENKMFDKTVSSFQIDNFKEIIHGKSTDLTSTVNEKSQLIRKEETLQARERESFDNHSHDLVENKTTSGDTDNDYKSRNVSNVKPPKDIMHRMHHYAHESEDVMYETTSQDDTRLCVPSKTELQNAQLTSESSSGGFSIFAEPINDSCSIGGDSNTQSLIDRNHFNDTDPDMDTDTESHCKGNIAEHGDETDFAARGMQLDYADVQRLKSSRNTMSSASSQASIDFLDHVPYSRREIVRRRRQALCYIFSFLDCETLFRVAMVCREWKIVSRNPNLWTRLQLRKNRISGKFLSQLARRCCKLRFLILEDLQPRPQLKSETIEEYIESTRCSLEAGLEQILKRSESTLVSLSIVNCGYMLSSKCLWAASCYSRMLNHVTYLSDIDPISAEVLWALGSGCRDIKTFRVAPIYPCQKPGIFNTKCLQLVGKCFRDLEILSIGGYEVDLSAMTFVAKCCQRLECLELDHMGIVTKSLVKEVTDVGFKSIRELRFMGTPIESSAVKLLYDTCKHLKFIEIKLAPEDYFEGTQKPNDMKRYKGEMEKLKALSKIPGLGQILKLTL